MKDKGCILYYDLSKVNSTIIADLSGYGQAGVIRNYDRGGALLLSENIYGKEAATIRLPGGKDGGYIEFPNGVLKDSSSFTISFFFRCLRCDEKQTLFSLGSGAVCSVMLDPDDTDGFSCFSLATSGGLSQGAFGRPIRLKYGAWYELTLTMEDYGEESRITLYVNGFESDILIQKKIKVMSLIDATECYMGHGPFTYSELKGELADIRIYSRALCADEISSAFNVSDKDRTEFDKHELTLTSETVMEDISLPVHGKYGSLISWESSDPTVIDDKGVVNRPAAGCPDASVILTATLKYGEVTVTKDFAFTVPALPTVGETLSEELSSIIISDESMITDDIDLVTKGSSGSVITWSSDKPHIISNSGNVIRPYNNPEYVLLTAVAVKESVRRSRTFKLRVMPVMQYPVVTDSVPITVSVEKGCAPLLPSKVAVKLSDGTYTHLNVTWPDFSTHATAASTKIFGSLEGSDYKVPAEIIVNELISNSTDHRKLRKGHYPALSEVSLTGLGILVSNRDRCLDYLKLLDCDRMLYDFRLTFGEDTKGAVPPGGWDEPTGLLRGHSTGHFLSALALAYGSTGDSDLLHKLEYMVSELKKLQQKCHGRASDFVTACTPAKASQSLWSKDCSTWGEGYISAYSPDQFALLEQYTPYATIWAPYYTLHKILAGLLDCYSYAGSNEALEVSKGIGEWVYDRLSATTPEQRAGMWKMYIAGEYGGMNESLATLSRLTGDSRFLQAAQYFDNPKIFDGLSVGLDTISGIHANQHIPQIIGALEEYEASHDIKYYNIAASFWKIVTAHYAYSIGGVGRGEVFKEPDILAGNIDSDRNCETCAMYNMLKLTERLYAYEPGNAFYMDYFEKGLFNQIAASQNPVITPRRHHGVTYMLPIGPGARREYSSDYDDFTCCHGTGMENHVKYQHSVFFTDESDKTIYVNLYTNAELKDPSFDDGSQVLLSMAVDENLQKCTIEIRSDSEYRLKFRVPAWAGSSFGITHNEKDVILDRYNAIPSTYCETGMICKSGDTFTIDMPYKIRVEATPDKPDGAIVASICYGPYVMAALSDTTDTIRLSLLPNLNSCFTVGWDEEGSYPILDHFGLKFVPMYAAHNVCYHTYFKIEYK